MEAQELTSVKFRPDPAGGDKRIYFTGDLGRRRPDGCIEYLGRKDFRVKIHGFGVEPGEIESVILSHGRVRETVVTVVEQNNDTRLIAYITPTKETEPTAGELRSYLTSKLPGYMVPSDFIFLDALPLTPMVRLIGWLFLYQTPSGALKTRQKLLRALRWKSSSQRFGALSWRLIV